MSILELQKKLASRRYSEKTSKAYTMWIRQLMEYCAGSIDDVPTNTIASFLERQNRRGLKTESVRQAISAIKYYYRDVSPRPDIVLVLPSIKRTRPKTHIPEQQEIAEIIGNIDDPELQSFFYLIYGTGLELGEAITLPARSVNPKTQTLTFKTQRKKLRSTPIPKLIAPTIIRIASTRKHSELLFQCKGKVISKTKAQRLWTKARQTAHAEPRIDIRSLRHAYIYHLTNSGYLIQEVLHHLQLNASVALDYYSKYVDLREVTISPLDLELAKSENTSTIYPYVARQRIYDLTQLKHVPFDLARVLSVLIEINESARVANLHSIALLVRMLIDHTAPIFGKGSFKEVVNNSAIPRSLKKNLELLDAGLRNIADLFLHSHISRHISLPTELQVDFRHSLDQYLGYMIKELQKASASSAST